MVRHWFARAVGFENKGVRREKRGFRDENYAIYCRLAGEFCRCG